MSHTNKDKLAKKLVEPQLMGWVLPLAEQASMEAELSELLDTCSAHLKG
jgi:hypothetical protein